jgi:hypothetical protein
VSQHQSRKSFLAKVLALAGVAMAAPRVVARQNAGSLPEKPAAPLMPVAVTVETRAVARRNASL